MSQMVSIDWTLPRTVHTDRGPERRLATVLHEFLSSKRDEIIARTKAKVAARAAPRATEAELTHGIPLFFDQLIEIMMKCSMVPAPK